MLKKYRIIFSAIALKDLTLKSIKALRIFATFSGQLDSYTKQDFNFTLALISYKCLYIKTKHN
jgi:hypothetical protein